MARNCPQTLLAVKLPLQNQQRQIKQNTPQRPIHIILEPAGATASQSLAKLRRSSGHCPMVVRSYIYRRINLHNHQAALPELLVNKFKM